MNLFPASLNYNSFLQPDKLGFEDQESGAFLLWLDSVQADLTDCHIAKRR